MTTYPESESKPKPRISYNDESEAVSQALAILDEAGYSTVIIMAAPNLIDNDGNNEVSEIKPVIGLHGVIISLGALLFEGSTYTVSALRDRDPEGMEIIEQCATQIVMDMQKERAKMKVPNQKPGRC